MGERTGSRILNSGYGRMCWQMSLLRVCSSQLPLSHDIRSSGCQAEQRLTQTSPLWILCEVENGILQVTSNFPL
jgi:hypothetical protein